MPGEHRHSGARRPQDAKNQDDIAHSDGRTELTASVLVDVHSVMVTGSPSNVPTTSGFMR
jgi:hypothetical protein